MARTILCDLCRKDPGRKVETVVDDGIILHCDRRLMQTALTHLFENAWKFTSPKDQAKIEFGCKRSPGQIQLYVRDNGVGFNQAYAGKLFLPFQRMHSREDFPGNGIGLAIVASIVHRHDGEVHTESALDEGTTVSLTLQNNEELASHDEQRDLAG